MPIRSRTAPLPARMTNPRNAFIAAEDYPPPVPVLLAANARTADAPQRCAGCDHAILPGQRLADLPGGGVVHVAGCAARA